YYPAVLVHRHGRIGVKLASATQSKLVCHLYPRICIGMGCVCHVQQLYLPDRGTGGIRECSGKKGIPSVTIGYRHLTGRRQWLATAVLAVTPAVQVGPGRYQRAQKQELGVFVQPAGLYQPAV